MSRFKFAIRLLAVVLLVLLAAGGIAHIPTSVGSRLVELVAELGAGLFVTGPPENFLAVVVGLVLEFMGTGLLVVLPLAALLALRFTDAVPGPQEKDAGRGQYIPELPKLVLGFFSSLSAAMRACRDFVTTGRGGRDLPLALMKPIIYLAAALLVLGWYSRMPAVVTSPPLVRAAYVVSEAAPNRELLPVHLLVHFHNAAIDREGQLTGQGISLDAAREAELQATVETLSACVGASASGKIESGVTIQSYGFASDDKFRGLSVERSNELNVAAANQRGRVVHEALVKIAEDVAGVTVEPAKVWKNLTQMARKRNSMIKFANENDRNAFADRVVILFVSDSGLCRIQQSAPAQPSGNTAASANG